MDRETGYSISIIVTSYNTGYPLLEDCLKSVLAQSYANWELILVDDGSSEDNKIALFKLRDTFDNPRIKILELPCNVGKGAALNEGMDLAQGEIITFLDADDMLLPWHLEEINRAFTDNPESTLVHTYNILYINILPKTSIFAFTTYDTALKQDAFASPRDIEAQAICPRLSLRRTVADMIRYDSSINCDREMILQLASIDELLSKKCFLSRTGYLYRNHRSKDRLRYKLKTIIAERNIYFQRYSGRNPAADGIIAEWKKNNPLVKYSHIFSSTSFCQTLLNVLTSRQKPKERFQCIWLLLIITATEISTFLCGADLHYFSNLARMLTGRKCNQVVKRHYSEHLNKNGNRGNRYAVELFERLFE